MHKAKGENFDTPIYKPITWGIGDERKITNTLLGCWVHVVIWKGIKAIKIIHGQPSPHMEHVATKDRLGVRHDQHALGVTHVIFKDKYDTSTPRRASLAIGGRLVNVTN